MEEVLLSEERREDTGCSWQLTAMVALCPKPSSLSGATRIRCWKAFAPSERTLGRRRDHCSWTAESNVDRIPSPWSRQGRMTATGTERSHHWMRPCVAVPAARSRIHAVHAVHVVGASHDIELGISESLLFLCDANVPCTKQRVLAHVQSMSFVTNIPNALSETVGRAHRSGSRTRVDPYQTQMDQ